MQHTAIIIIYSSYRQMQPGDILLHGHTHVPAWTCFGEQQYYLNPGSVSIIPKEDSCHSYMILENACFEWKNMDGEVYHTLKTGCLRSNGHIHGKILKK